MLLVAVILVAVMPLNILLFFRSENLQISAMQLATTTLKSLVFSKKRFEISTLLKTNVKSFENSPKHIIELLSFVFF